MANIHAGIEKKHESDGSINLEKERRKIKQMKFIFALFSILLILSLLVSLATTR